MHSTPHPNYHICRLFMCEQTRCIWEGLRPVAAPASPAICADMLRVVIGMHSQSRERFAVSLLQHTSIVCEVPSMTNNMKNPRPLRDQPFVATKQSVSEPMHSFSSILGVPPGWCCCVSKPLPQSTPLLQHRRITKRMSHDSYSYASMAVMTHSCMCSISITLSLRTPIATS
jgi:hypothetical protein